MAKLTTRVNLNLWLGNDPGDYARTYNFWISEILRLLPKGTTLINSTDKVLEFNCPFFKNDFEFDVQYTREVLSDGDVMYQYDQATKILTLQNEAQKHG